ncbi:MAG: ABC transporter ATP-binding protein [Oenococcus sp.]|uniref:ABC transporter ATP-binding protein n=1 Tax=Oenococcus TaxID=46254 RepID=UPI0021E8DB71|nr:ABC transporter ATP-binding protein [Oenococcus kitaharae]MCV3296088.1 ABC transporter ATP-binding protein [Oenococcus kitaharae]
MTLEVSHLTGGYGQANTIEDISFTVASGTLTALIGLNGSGKTTTINHLIGIMKPKTGQIIFDNIDSQKEPVRYQSALSYIPELPVVYEDLTLNEHVQTTISAYHLDEKKAESDAQRLFKIFRLEDKGNWFPIDFSKGMRQKVMIVMALLADTPLLIIDEPFIGLDPLAVADLIDLLKEKKAAGSTILMSTHVIAGAEEFVDQFLLLDQGKIRVRGHLKDIFQAFPKQQTIDGVYYQLAKEAEK